MGKPDQQFLAWEQFIRTHSLRSKRYAEEGLVGIEIEVFPSSSVRVDQLKLEERWVQRYVAAEFERLGFAKIRGPYTQGPDFEVLHKRRWKYAEVERHWRNYLQHGHPENSNFDEVEFLILLSTEPVPAKARPQLPPQIVYIDRAHFLTWFETACEQHERNNARFQVIAGALRDEWVYICSDKDRDMSTCPDCDGCPYFGEGMFGEASPYFEQLSARFVASEAMTDKGADITTVKPESLRKFLISNL